MEIGSRITVACVSRRISSARLVKGVASVFSVRSVLNCLVYQDKSFNTVGTEIAERENQIIGELLTSATNHKSPVTKHQPRITVARGGVAWYKK
jgi:hypothetical protein